MFSNSPRVFHCRRIKRLSLATGVLALSVVVPRALPDTPPPGGIRAESAENPHHWKPRVSSVSVFKNGLGFFRREGPVTLRDGWCVAGAVPPAMYGTFAVFSHDEGQSVDIVGTGSGEQIDFDGVDEVDSLEARSSRLNDYLGLDLELSYVGLTGAAENAQGTLSSIGPDFAILDRGGQHIAVPIRAMSSIRLLELPMRVHVAEDSGDAAIGATQLGMAYVRQGITWIPEYTLRVLDDQTAELILRGTLVNEAEDLIHCDVDFVVGVPHFVHESMLTPVALGQVIRSVGTALVPPGLQGQILSRASMASNSISSNPFQGGGGGGVVEQPVGVGRSSLGGAESLAIQGGSGASDLTVYRKKNMTVRRGEKAMVTLLRTTVSYSHLYRWTPPARPQHFLKIKNDTDTAWTTGPGLCVSGSLPLSEDLVKYTPRGGTCAFPLTTAVNVGHDRRESELEREMKSIEPSRGHYFDRVIVGGDLRIKSFEPTTVDLEIDLPVAGRPLEADGEGVMSVDSERLVLTERRGQIRWSFQLEPGVERALTYRYERYVRSG